MSNQFPILYGGLSKIHKSVRKAGRTKKITPLQKILTHKNVNELDQYGNTPAMITIRCGTTIQILDLLNDCGADFTIQNDQGYDCLLCAIIYQYYDIVEWLLTHHMFTRKYDMEGRGILDIVILRYIRVLPLILEYQACDQDEKDNALHFLCKNNYIYGPALYESHSDDLNNRIVNLWSYGKECASFHIKILLQYGADPNSSINGKYPITHFLDQYKDHIGDPSTCDREYDINNILTLIQHGAIFFPENYDRHLAQISNLSYETISYLFSNLGIEFDMNRPDHSGNNYLLYYCKKGRYFNQLFCNRNLNVNVQDSNGNTPLHILVRRHQFSQCISLLETYHPSLLVNNDQHTAFYYLITYSMDTNITVDEKLIECFVEAGADIEEIQILLNNPLLTNWQKKLKDLINTLVEKYHVDIKEPE